MANSFDSNFTRKVARVFMKAFETNRSLSKSVNTQLLSGRFGPDTGENVDFKRPTDYISQRTSDGDISLTTASSIITGKATGTVQDYITVEVDFQEADEALKMDQLDQLLAPMAKRIVTDLEVDFGGYMMKNCNLLAGTYGVAVASWDHVAEAGAVLESHGVPKDGMWNYAVNPYTQTSLASVQRSLGAGSNANVDNAHERAIISHNFAGMQVMTATALASYTTHSGSDRAGTLSGNPTVTYVGHKDTMVQTLPVTAFNANLQVRAGEMVQITGSNRLNLSTRQPVVNGSGANVLFTGVVTTAVTLGSSGEGNLTIAGPAIYEAAGQYNTVDAAPVSTRVVTLLGSASTMYQPNLFWHRDAYAIGSMPIKKLYSTDTLATTEDGLQIRVSKGASIRENKQIVRFDLRPAYATLNPFFAGQAWGRS